MLLILRAITAFILAIYFAGCGVSGGVSSTAGLPSITNGGGTGSASVSILTPADKSFVSATNQSSMVFSGACSFNNQVVFVAAGSVTGTATCTNLSWTTTLDLSPLSDGSIAVYAKHSTLQSQVATAQIALTKKATAPTLAITSPAAGTTITAGQVSAFTVSGTCSENGQTIKAGADGTGSTLCTSGAFTLSANFSAATNGAVALVLTLVDSAGNSTTTSRSFAKNSAAPTLTLTSPAATTWINNANKASFAVSGACSENGQNVVITGAATATVVCAAGAWSANLNFTAAADGVATISLAHTNATPVTTTISQSFNKNVAGPTVALVSPTAGSYVNSANKTVFAVSGTCTVLGANVTFSGASTAAMACASGVFSGTLDLSANSDGALTLTATQTDPAGNSSSVNLSLNKDTVAPTLTLTAPAANAYVQGTATLTGACLTSTTVSIAGDITGSPVSASCTASAYSQAVTFTAGDGIKNITVTQTKASGNATTLSRSFNKLTVAPVLTQTTIASALTTNGNSVTFGGACAAGLSIAVTNTDSGSATCSGAGTWSYTTATQTTDGARTYTFTETDAAGNTSTLNTTWTRNTVGPAVTVTSPAAASTVSSTVTLAGSCTNGLPVNVTAGVAGAPIALTCSAGSYSQSVTTATPDGALTITVSQTDASSNTTTVNRNVTRLTALPALTQTTLTSPYTSATNSVTFGGACTNGLSIVVSGTDTSSATCSGGTWTYSTGNQTSDNAYSYTFTQTDAASNVKTVTAIWNRNTGGGTVLGFNSPASGTMAQTGVTIAGSCQNSIATINITGDVSSPASTTCSGSAFSVAVTFTAGDGAKVVTLTQPTGSTVNRTFTRNNVAPAVAFTSPAAASTTLASVNVAGTCASGINVILTGPITGAPITVGCPVGVFNQPVTITGADGAKTLTATQTDAATNVGTATLNLTLNSTTPTLSVTSPTAGSYVNIANKAAFTVSGNCSENGRAVTFSGPSSFSDTVNCSGGTFSKALNLTALSDGAFTIAIAHTNAAGTSVAASLALNKLTTTPTLTVTSPTGAAYVNTTNLAAVPVTGTCGSIGATVNLTGSISGSAVCGTGNTFSTTLNFTAAGNGAVSTIANMNDAAGNPATQITVNFNKSTTGPTLTISSATLTNNTNTATFSGTCVASSTITITGTDSTTATCTGGSTWSYTTATQSTDASRSYAFAETNTAGNTTTVNGTWVRNTVPPVVGFSLPLPGTAVNTTTGITISGYCASSAGTVALSGAGLASPASTACTANAFSQAITMTAGDGSKTITVGQTDTAGNTASSSRTFSLLTAGPTVTLTSPANNAYTQANVTLSGGCTNGLSVLVTGPFTGSPINATCSGAAWSQPVVLTAPDAAKAISASQTDGASNTSTANVTLNRLTAAPTIGFTSPTAGSVIGAGNYTSYAVAGTCTLAATTVTFSGPTGFTGGQTATCNGSAFSKNLTFTGVSDGPISVTASITDQAGNVGTTSLLLSKAVTATAVTVTSPTANSYINSSNATTQTVSGTCAGQGSGGTVTFATGGTHANVTCTTNAWSATNVNFSGASDGTVTLVLNFADQGSGTASTYINYIKDTVAPTTPTLNSYAAAYNSLAQTPSFTWATSTDATSGLNHYDVALGTSSGGTQTVTWTNVGTVTTYQFTGLSLTTNTNYYISVRAVDNAGNISTVSAGAAYLADTTAPTAPSSLTYASSTTSLTALPAFSFTGSTDTGGSGVAYYEVAIGTTAGGTDVLNYSNTGASNIGTSTSAITMSGLSLTVNSSYYISIKAIDNAGNASSAVQGAACLITPLTSPYGRVVFAYTGANQTFTVPTGVSQLTVRMWGAGGGGSNASYTAQTGGAGGFTQANLNVTPGQTLTVIVGGGGAGAPAGGTSGNIITAVGGGWPDGGGRTAVFEGAGGGRSAIQISGTEYITAGGGGGAGTRYSGVGSGNGGGGGGVVGGSGGTANTSGGGAGGGQSSGGAAGQGMYNGAAGAQFAGATMTSGSYGSCGGGGGYYGGGAAAIDYGASANGGGCGGGSGYIGGTGVTNGMFVMGNAGTAPLNTDADYVAGVASGGGSITAGGNGLVVIRWGDEPFSDTLAMALHMDGANNSTTFVDQAGNVVTAMGGAKISTAQSKFGGASAYFNGGPDYLSFSDNSALDIGVGGKPFTIEGWIYYTSSATQVLLARGGPGGNSWSTTNGRMYDWYSVAGVLGFEYNLAGVQTFMSGSQSLSNNTWYHIALSYDGTTLRQFINGKLDAAAAMTGITRPTSTGTTYMGYSTFSTSPLYAYIDDFKILNGVAKYVTQFTPPTAAFGTSTLTDSYWNNVTLALHMTGANSGTTFTDSSSLGLSVTASGPVTSTAQSMFSGSSGYFNTSTAYLNVADNAGLDIGGSGNPFTIETWANFTSIAGIQNIFDRGGGANNWNTTNGELFQWYQNAGTLTWTWNNSGAQGLIASSISLATNTWYHLAVSYDGTTVRMFINGSQVASAASSGITKPTTSNVTHIGREVYGSTYPLYAYLNDLRLTKGISRYTSSFTPPTAAYTITPSTSCNASLTAASPQTLSDGYYIIDPLSTGNSYRAMCDMTDGGGGWTQFYAGKNGSPNVFAYFETTTYYNSNGNYMRRIPSNVGTSNWFAASANCGGNKMVKFQIPSGGISLLQSGTQGSWQTLTGLASIGSTTASVLPAYFFAGVSGASNYSFIVSTTQGSGTGTFISGYGANGAFDSCDGTANTTATTGLWYR